MARVGFIGLGAMGGPMARNLLKHGHDLAVFDAASSALARFRDTGARLATSPADAARDVEFLITMLPTSADVTAALLGENGAASTMRAGSLFIDCTTASPTQSTALAVRLQQRQIRMLDAPVGRPPYDAEAGTLLFIVGGAPEDLAAARPLFDCMGSEIVHCGPLGTGATVKVVNNYMSVMGMVVAAETLALGAKAGISHDLMLSVLQRTVAGLGAINVLYPRKVLAGDLTPTFSMRLALKDLSLGVELGAELGVPLVSGAAGRNLLALGKPKGRMDQDVTGLLLLLEEITRSEPPAS
jgi:4-hydroxybutyrate dehydrogenase/sulfolactaldehyde 3-reductase